MLLSEEVCSVYVHVCECVCVCTRWSEGAPGPDWDRSSRIGAPRSAGAGGTNLPLEMIIFVPIISINFLAWGEVCNFAKGVGLFMWSEGRSANSKGAVPQASGHAAMATTAASKPGRATVQDVGPRRQREGLPQEASRPCPIPALALLAG